MENIHFDAAWLIPPLYVSVFTTEPEGKTQKIPLMPPTPAPRKFFPPSVSTTKQDVKVKAVTDPDNQRRFTLRLFPTSVKSETHLIFF